MPQPRLAPPPPLRGYANHPETRRWRGRLKALYMRHDALVTEMTRRGYRHYSPLPKALATGDGVQREHIHCREEQSESFETRDVVAPCNCAQIKGGRLLF